MLTCFRPFSNRPKEWLQNKTSCLTNLTLHENCFRIHLYSRNQQDRVLDWAVFLFLFFLQRFSPVWCNVHFFFLYSLWLWAASQVQRDRRGRSLEFMMRLESRFRLSVRQINVEKNITLYIYDLKMFMKHKFLQFWEVHGIYFTVKGVTG